MRKKRFLLLLPCAFLLQLTVVRLVEIRGTAPDLLLCMTLFLLLYFNSAGIAAGACVATGLLYDICFSGVIGASAVAVLILAILLPVAKKALNIEDHLLPLLTLTACGTLLYHMVLWGCIRLTGSNYAFLYILGKQPLYILWNLLFMSIFYVCFMRGKKGWCNAW